MATILESVSFERDDIVGTFPPPIFTIFESVSLEGGTPRHFVIVRDSGGGPIEGVTVTITDANSVILETTTTNALGFSYTLVDSNVANPVTITFTKAGFTTYVLRLVTFQDDTFLEVTLQSGASSSPLLLDIEVNDEIELEVEIDDITTIIKP